MTVTMASLPSMMGLWDSYYTEPREYGNPRTYQIAANWLNGQGGVEDWGCGTCAARPYIDNYLGIDGSGSFADIKADLQTYQSRPRCILIRHVLEHNIGWRTILHNALVSFQKRMAIVLFMPLQRKEEILYWQDGIPYIHLPREVFLNMIAPFKIDCITEGDESCYLLEKN